MVEGELYTHIFVITRDGPRNPIPEKKSGPEMVIFNKDLMKFLQQHVRSLRYMLANCRICGGPVFDSEIVCINVCMLIRYVALPTHNLIQFFFFSPLSLFLSVICDSS